MIRRINAAQMRVLNNLLDDGRMNRLLEQEAMAKSKSDVYTLAKMLDDVRHRVWSELSSSSPVIDGYRRELQMDYLSAIDRKINPPRRPVCVAGRRKRTSAPSMAVCGRQPMRHDVEFCHGRKIKSASVGSVAVSESTTCSDDHVTTAIARRSEYVQPK
jgi:hypothetical protein